MRPTAAPMRYCSGDGRTTSSRRTGRTSRADRTTASRVSSTGFPSTSPRAIRARSTGPDPRYWARIYRPQCARSESGIRTSRSWAVWTWCRRCCGSGCSTASTCGCTPSCLVSARRCSTPALCRRASPSWPHRRRAPVAPCSCSTRWGTARRRPSRASQGVAHPPIGFPNRPATISPTASTQTG